MKDGPARRAVKFIARCVFNVNVAGTRAIWRLLRRRPHQLGGECGKCAACCEAPGIQVGFILWYFPTARGLFLWWQKHVNGFELIERDIPHRVYVFRCTHFDPATRRCDSYDTRPGMCRDYPRVHLWEANPQFLPGCGYRAVRCGADKFIEALRKEGLEGEELERVKEKLKLK
jgi:Fe-S-cluster containining protein